MLESFVSYSHDNLSTLAVIEPFCCPPFCPWLLWQYYSKILSNGFTVRCTRLVGIDPAITPPSIRTLGHHQSQRAPNATNQSVCSCRLETCPTVNIAEFPMEWTLSSNDGQWIEFFYNQPKLFPSTTNQSVHSCWGQVLSTERTVPFLSEWSLPSCICKLEDSFITQLKLFQSATNRSGDWRRVEGFLSGSNDQFPLEWSLSYHTFPSSGRLVWHQSKLLRNATNRSARFRWVQAVPTKSTAQFPSEWVLASQLSIVRLIDHQSKRVTLATNHSAR